MKLGITRALLAAGATVAFVASSPGVSAQTVEFTGSTAGCFFTTTCSVQSVATYNDMTYANSTFDVFTNLGFTAVGAPPATPNVNNFGSLTLGTAPATYSGEFFKLQITFTAPADGASNQIFNATLTGTVAQSGNGVFIDFDNSKIFFGSQNQYAVQVNDVSVTAGGDVVPITGNLWATSTVPEPASMTLLGTGLLGLAGLARRRRRQVS